jgi:Nitrile hydratase, alpha chain
MTEASGGGVSRVEWERRLINRSLEDEDFRQRLLEDPKAAVEQELGSGLPEGVEVRAVEESADTIYLVLPSASALGEGEEISDQDLEEVAGGEVGPGGPGDVPMDHFPTDPAAPECRS